MGVTVEVEISIAQVQREIERQEKHIETALNKAVDRLLDYAAQEQILSYTAAGNPILRRGQTYIRTFTLQGASQTRRTGTQLPDISGVWSADENKAPYAKYVLGRPSEQARIHRRRWKSLSQVEKTIKELTPLVVQQELSR